MMRFSAAAMFIGAALVTAGSCILPACALTYDTHGFVNADGSSRFQDLQDHLDGKSKNGFSVQFSGQGSGGSSGSADRLFLPSINHASSSPFSRNGFDNAMGSH